MIGKNKMKNWQAAVRTWEPPGFIPKDRRPQPIKPPKDPWAVKADAIIARFPDQQISDCLALERRPPGTWRDWLISSPRHCQKIIDKLMNGVCP
jgi:hypothetical protein